MIIRNLSIVIQKTSWLWIFVLILQILGCAENKTHRVEDIYLPDVVTFAGDTIPTNDPDIKERLEKELWINAYWQSNTAQLIKKSGRWFPMIDSILKSHDIPSDFKYLVAIESSFENVTSNKGAVGFWQLMEPTAKEFGLKVNPEIDERLNPEKSTVAAVLLLKRGKKNLGNWAAVAASYNIGIQGLKNVMGSQYTDDFYDLLINQETGRYLFRALACKLIFTEPEKYGFGVLTNLKPIANLKVRIDTSISDIAYWSRQNGFSYKCFRQANPWVKTNRLTTSDSIPFFEISLPTTCITYTKLAISGKKPSDSTLNANEQIVQNLVNQKNMIAHKNASIKDSMVVDYHMVRSGENLSLIAQKYNLTVQQIFDLNPGLQKKQNKIDKGSKIKIR